MEDIVYELIDNLNRFSTYDEVTEAINKTLEYFDIEKNYYKKQRIIKYWRDKANNYITVEGLNNIESRYPLIFSKFNSPFMYVTYYFAQAYTIKDFKFLALEILNIYENELLSNDNSLISEGEIKDALDIICEKIPYLNEIDLKSKIIIFLHDVENIKYNAYTIIQKNKHNEKYYLINCFKTTKYTATPIAVFFHELGHVIASEVTDDSSCVPYTFYKLSKKIIDINNVITKEAILEIFCEFFAYTMMQDTKYQNDCSLKLGEEETKVLNSYYRHIELHTKYFHDYSELSRYFNKLKKRVSNGEVISAHDLTCDEWKQLSVVENCGPGALEIILKEDKEKIKKIRENKIKRVIKDYSSLDRLTYFFVLEGCIRNSVELLKEFDYIGVKEIYDINYEDFTTYKKLFNIKEEIKKQEDIAIYNKNNPQDKKETLYDFLYKRVINMYLRGELVSEYFDMGYIINKELLIEKIIKNAPKEPVFSKKEEEIIETVTKIKEHIPNKRKSTTSISKKDYYKQFDSQQKNGTIGEDFAYKTEIKRLQDYPDLQKRIIPYYKTDPNKGYDILSFTESGEEKHIEVKTSLTNTNYENIHFYISRNENEFIKNNKNACIYYVHKVNSELKIKEIKREQYLNIYKKPYIYEIDIDCE